MKSIFTSLFLALSCTILAADDIWLTDFEAAKTKAAAEKKSLLLNFTGSDWCGYCIQLDKEVFQKETFRESMKDKLVLVKIDFPEDESKITKETAERNSALQEQYLVDGYPTIILADASGKPFAITGYEEGGADKYITHLNTLIAKKSAFDAMIEEAAKLEGPAKAEKLGAALQSLDVPTRLLTAFHDETIGEIETLDPDTSTAFHKELKTIKRFLATESAVEALIESGKTDDAIALVDKGIVDESYNIDQRQRMSFFKTVVLMESEKYDQALAALEACRLLSPESEMSKSLDILKTHIETLQKENSVIPESAPQDSTPAQPEESPATEELEEP